MTRRRPPPPVDLPRIRAALQRLDELAVECPWLISGDTIDAAEWLDTLDEVLDRQVEAILDERCTERLLATLEEYDDEEDL